MKIWPTISLTSGCFSQGLSFLQPIAPTMALYLRVPFKCAGDGAGRKN